MRTRIALVAIIPVALSTSTTLTQAVTTQAARAQTTPSTGTDPSSAVALPPNRLVAYQNLAPGHPQRQSSALPFDVSVAMVPLDRPAGGDHRAPAPHRAAALPANRLVAYRSLASGAVRATSAALPFGVNAALLSHPVTGAATAAVPSTAIPPGTGPLDTVTPAQRASWERVAMCEEGGNWASSSGRFSGGLGITRANWAAFGGRQFAPEGAMATEDQQIIVAERIESTPPDQHGCRGW